MTEWQWKRFDELSKHELYEILKVRQEVFVVEQNCAYVDADGLDQNAWHLTGWYQNDADGRRIAAYLRVVFPGCRYEEPSIGRVLTTAQSRGRGLGKVLMETALCNIERIYPNQAIRISAQQYLERFYHALEFSRVSEPYSEDGIPHIEMLRRCNR
ncbi:MAG: GNAT family N-acetyltransferase [Exilibacterium sp.]